MKRPMTVIAIGLVTAAWLGVGAVEAAPRRPKAPKTPKPNPQAAPAATESPSASSSGIPVSVVEVAGAYAYLQPGAKAGVQRGARVTIRGREFTVIASTATYAVIDATSKPPAEDDKGVAAASDVAATDEVKKLPPPRPAESFRGVWPEPQPPSATQTAKHVPLGGTERNRRWDVRLSAAGGGIIPLDRSAAGIASGELRARVHAEPFSEPVAFDMDAAVQRWFASDLSDRLGGGSRPIVRVSELQLSYGRKRGLFAAIGRMRYAASTLGGLDGTRLQAPLGTNATVAAFGGVVPNPLSTAFETAAQRFGVEARYADVEASWRPEAALVVQGSTFEGKLDERRVMGLVGLYPGKSRLGGHFELSGFDKTNPWQASPFELTAAGIDGSARVGPVQLGARLDVRADERSRWLASFLPTSWLCTPAPQVPTTPPVAEPCAAASAERGLGAVDASVELGRVSFMAGGTVIRELGSGDGPKQLGGFVHGRAIRLFRVARFDASGSLSSGTYSDMFGWSAGPGVSLFADRLDLSAYYRQASLRYRSADQQLHQHGVGGMFMLFPNSELLFTLQGEGTTGDDSKALLLFLTAMWRPNL